MEKQEALAKFLNINVEDVEVISDDQYEAEGCEYLVYSDDEADEHVENCIRESVWAFNPNFIANHSRNGWSNDLVNSIKAIQSAQCESANSAITAIIDDMEHFVADAICSDGRGHFLSFYDGDEIELEGDYYAYRV